MYADEVVPPTRGGVATGRRVVRIGRRVETVNPDANLIDPLAHSMGIKREFVNSFRGFFGLSVSVDDAKFAGVA
jgi:hypothetical protein